MQYLIEAEAYPVDEADEVRLQYNIIGLFCSHAGHTCTYLGTYQNGNIPLIEAAGAGHLPVVKYLLEKGADLEAKDDEVSDGMSLI